MQITLFLRSVHDKIGCEEEYESEKALILRVTGIMLCISMLTSIVFIPTIANHVKGLKKIIIILQQACIMAFLTLLVIYEGVTNDAPISSTLRYSPSALVEEMEPFLGSTRSVPSVRFVRHWYEFVSYFIYHEYYLFSFLQSLDIYVMVCKPFQYEEFTEIANLLKIILKGSLLIFVLVSDCLVKILVDYFFSTMYEIKDLHRTRGQKYRIILSIECVNVANYIVLKVAYSVIIVRMALSVRRSLAESSKLTGQRSKHDMQRRLFRFTLIPVFLNLFFSFQEISSVIAKIYHAFNPTNSLNCLPFILVTKKFVVCLTATNITFGTLVYFTGYLALFTNVRRTFSCGTKTR